MWDNDSFNFFSAKTVSRVWDLFNLLPFEIKTRILILGIINIFVANSDKSNSFEKLLNVLFEDEIEALKNERKKVEQ